MEIGSRRNLAERVLFLMLVAVMTEWGIVSVGGCSNEEKIDIRESDAVSERVEHTESEALGVGESLENDGEQKTVPGTFDSLKNGPNVQVQQRELSQASDVLTNMRAFDKKFEAGFTASGVTPKGSFGVNSPEGRIAWTITLTDGQCAIVERIQDATEPSAGYVKRPEFMKDEEKIGRYAGVVKTRITFFGSEYSSRTSLIELYQPGPDGQPQKVDRDGTQVVDLYRPDDSALTLPYKQIMWSLGRGYARFINEVTEIAAQEDGTIYLGANGTGLGGSRIGRWEMTVDPSAAYMVRSAKFFRKPGKPMAVITTSGTKWENGRCVPETAIWQDEYGPGFSKRSVEYACNVIKSEPDYDLLKMVQEKLYGPYKRYTNVTDFRMMPPSVQRYKAGSTYSTLDRLNFDVLDIPDDIVAQEIATDEVTEKAEDRESEASGVGESLGDNDDARQIEMLLEAVRRSRRPAENMRVHMIFTGYGNPKDFSGSQIVGAANRQEDKVITICGNRRRVECEIRKFEEVSQVWQTMAWMVSVYNGQQYRQLRTIPQEGIYPKYLGELDVKGMTSETENILPGGVMRILFDMKDREALSEYTFELHPAPSEGVYVLDAIRNGYRRQFTIDGNKGFNVVKVLYFFPDGTLSSETSFKLRQYGEIWFPCEYDRIVGRPATRYTGEISKVEFDIAVEDCMFELEFPEGTRVFDQVEKSYFTVGAPTVDCLPSSGQEL